MMIQNSFYVSPSRWRHIGYLLFEMNESQQRTVVPKLSIITNPPPAAGGIKQKKYVVLLVEKVRGRVVGVTNIICRHIIHNGYSNNAGSFGKHALSLCV